MVVSSNSRSIYSYALAAVAIGYVVLLVALMHDAPDRFGSSGSGAISSFAQAQASHSASELGLQLAGRPVATCRKTEPSTWSCAVSGFVDAARTPCSATMQIDAHTASVVRMSATCGFDSRQSERTR